MKAKAVLLDTRNWLTERLARSDPGPGRKWIILICVVIALSAIGVRIFHWQDRHVEIVSGETSLGGVFNRYQKEAQRMNDEGGILFPRERPHNGDARMLVHPPGYSILLAGIFKTGIDPYNALWIFQVSCDAAAALVVFLIACELFNVWAATVAALLVAFSPHLAYYSLILSPDTLAVLPLLVAIYLFVRAYKRPRLSTVIAVGVFLGLSCWMRANALLLAPLLSLVTAALFPRGRRVVHALALTFAAIIVISPITIRNAVVFHRFIPVSIAAGENLAVGIGDYDKQGVFGMPRSDRETRMKDAQWNARPDYAASLWTPDGIERDKTRLARALEVIRAHPAWFAGVMVRRATFMLRYNDSRPHDWPEVSAIVPVVYAEPGFAHPITTKPPTSDSPTMLVMNGARIPASVAIQEGQSAIWTAGPEQLIAGGTVVARRGTVEIAGDGSNLQIIGDESEYGDQFASEPIAVRPNFDYVVSLPVSLVDGSAALKLTTTDLRVSLASAIIRGDMNDATSEDNPVDSASQPQRMREIEMPFATGNRSEVRIVLSNNGAPGHPEVHAGQARLFEIGPTPCVWTRYPRYIVRAVQRNIFTTSRLLPVILAGLTILVLIGDWRAVAILIAVPVYYLGAQSSLSTEYRYTLAIHYFLFVVAGVTFFLALVVLKKGSIWALKFLPSRRKN
jgi:hypothetical protein